MNAKPVISPLIFSINFAAAFAVPPVASKSSQITTRCPSLITSFCTSNVALPYSSVYDVFATFPGNFPAFLRRIIPLLYFNANAHAMMNPLDSIPAKTSTSFG